MIFFSVVTICFVERVFLNDRENKEQLEWTIRHSAKNVENGLIVSSTDWIRRMRERDKKEGKKENEKRKKERKK